MKKFKLTITIAEFVVYRATFSFSDEQYEKMLSGYKKSLDWGIVQTSVLERLTDNQRFDENRDYVKEAPDAVVAYMICKHVSLFGSHWSGYYNPLDDGDSSVDVEVDETGDIDWDCEIISD